MTYRETCIKEGWNEEQAKKWQFKEFHINHKVICEQRLILHLIRLVNRFSPVSTIRVEREKKYGEYSNVVVFCKTRKGFVAVNYDLHENKQYITEEIR